jgi:5'-nucleotidase
MLRVTGAQLKRMIRHMLRDEVWEGAHCEFYQFSTGVRVTYSKSLHDFVRFNLNGEPIDDNKLYKIGLQHFHFLNVEKFFSVPLAEIEKNGKPRMVSTSCREILDEYLSVHPNLERSVTGRLIVED